MMKVTIESLTLCFKHSRLPNVKRQLCYSTRKNEYWWYSCSVGRGSCKWWGGTFSTFTLQRETGRRCL